eukprot:2415578-Prymnesium_polylepis.1
MRAVVRPVSCCGSRERGRARAALWHCRCSARVGGSLRACRGARRCCARSRDGCASVAVRMCLGPSKRTMVS